MGSEHRPIVSPAQSLLHALIDTIDRSLRSATYLHETRELLKALKVQLTWYEDALHAFPAGFHDEFDDLSEGIVEEFLRGKTGIVEDIKGLCEGTTAAIPYALATYLNKEFRRLYDPKPEGSWPLSMPRPKQVRGGVALCPFRQFNYFYQDVGHNLEKIFGKLDAMIIGYCENSGLGTDKLPARDKFPGSLAMIGFQYAMASDIIQQAVLFHELGHHLFAMKELPDTACRGRLLEKLKERLPEEFLLAGVEDTTRRTEAIEENATRIRDDMIIPWIGELFADAFAIAIGGPQYGLAFRDLTGPSKRERTFTETHPADLLRRHQQWKTLQEAGWAKGMVDGPPRDEDFASLASGVFRRLEPGDDLANVSWKFLHPFFGTQDEPPGLDVFVTILKEEFDWIAKSAVACVDDADSRCAEFWALGPEVMKLFERAVVPSTIVLKQSSLGERAGIDVDGHLDPDGGDKGEAWIYRPQPCTVMNVARVIYETGCGKLLEDWPPPQQAGETVPKDKLFVVHARLSDWTQKAIADWLLYEGQEKRG